MKPNRERFLAWIDDNLRVIRVRSSGNAVVDRCPFCGRAGKLEIKIGKGKRFGLWNCWTCRTRGGAVALIAEVEGISFKAAARIVKGRRSDLVDEEPEELDEDLDARLVIPLPDEFVPCYDEAADKFTIPVYLRDRGVSRPIMRRFGIGFCNDGPYARRVIVPVRCDGSETFVARHVSDGRPPYLTPGITGAPRLLFGFDLVEPGTDLVLVEGVFDALRLIRFGFTAVATLGKVITEDQATLVRRLAPRSITLALDPDAIADAHEATTRFALDAPVKVAEFPEGVDPGDSTLGQAREALDNSRPSAGRLDALNARLAGLRRY